MVLVAHDDPCNREALLRCVLCHSEWYAHNVCTTYQPGSEKEISVRGLAVWVDLPHALSQTVWGYENIQDGIDHVVCAARLLVLS
jgi:hypothetical protein